MAEYVVAPATRLFRIPPEVSPRVAALAEPIAVAVHGLRRGGFRPDQRVLVLGAGSIGLVTLLCARALGAKDVSISARHAHQATIARDFGATRVLAESEATAAALGARAMREGADLVVETVGGTADTLRTACAALAPGGTISVLGLFTTPVTLDPFAMLLREGTVAWSNCYARSAGRADFDDAVMIIDRERERLERLLTHSYPFADVDRAFAAASDKRAGAIKVTLVPASA
jgi:L-iditol 2-dehydrogenase